MNTATVFLGDRVKINSMEIKEDTIILSLKTHSAKDAMCCPTLEMVKRFTVKENKLIAIADEAP